MRFKLKPGAGGMGEAYRPRDAPLGRNPASKCWQEMFSRLSLA